MDKLIEFLSERPFVLGDGAMGTMLHAAGMTAGARLRNGTSPGPG